MELERDLWGYLKTATKPIVLYGMGNGADKIINILEQKGIEFKGVFASDGFVKEKYFHGLKLSSYAELKQKFGDMIVLVCFGSSRPEVIENIKKIAKEQELYAPEVPVFGGGLFTEEYYLSNKQRFDEIYNLLADEQSKKTFTNIIKYKISGKIDYLFDCEVTPDEPFKSFLNLSDNESFLDLGAYNGDTVLDFVSRVPKYDSITAVEADKKTFKKLLANTENIENINCVNICISSFCGEGQFSMKGGRNSTSEKGSGTAEFITIDKLLEEKKATYIKMDIEGEELNAIKEKKKIITQAKPKMLISAYHRTEDLLSIPEAVLKYRDDYKIYIRHFSSVPAWDTNYYFIEKERG